MTDKFVTILIKIENAAEFAPKFSELCNLMVNKSIVDGGRVVGLSRENEFDRLEKLEDQLSGLEFEL